MKIGMVPSYNRVMERTVAAIEEEQRQEQRKLRTAALLTALAALGLVLGVVFQFTGVAQTWIWVAFTVAYLAGGVPAAIGAFGALSKGKLDIDLLMVLAALAAAAVGEPRDGAILLFLFSLAGTLEDYAMGNTKRAVTSLMQLRPDTANLRANGETRTVGVTELRLGDVVVVKPGERMPIDGKIISGQTAVDQSPITGESVPVDKGIDDLVFAGTVNGHGALEVKVSKLASESTLARMVDLVTEAQEQRAPSQRFSDWFGARYTVFVLVGTLVALGVFLLLGLPSAEAFYKAATLLVVASPCAIVISVPAAVLSALAAAARGGVLFKGGAALEDFGHAKVVALDKTGTLTEGRMNVTDVVPVEGTRDEVLAVLGSLEANSEHPIAKSILSEARRVKVALQDADDVSAVPGKGVHGQVSGQSYWAGNRKLAQAQGVSLTAEVEAAMKRLESEAKTTLLLGSDRVLGLVGIADTVRPSAQATLNRLRSQGIGRIVMLTGDHADVALAVGTQLGFAPEDIHAGLLPEDKVRLVNDLSQENAVAYVGDGVNDAAALATASVGVAMGSAGSDVALEAADVALLSDDLGKLPDTYALAQRANRVIRQNLAFALGIMVIMVVVTLFWHLPLPLGVIGHEGGTLLVVANGLRLLWGTKKPESTVPAAKQILPAT